MKRAVLVTTEAKVKNVLTMLRIQVKREPMREKRAKIPMRITARLVQKATW